MMHSENILECWVGQDKHCCNQLVGRMGPFSVVVIYYLPLLLVGLAFTLVVWDGMSSYSLPSERSKTVPYLPN